MELVLNQKLESVPEPVEVLDFTNQGLLNSEYKSLVKQNFKSLNSKSVFGIRQRLKSAQYAMVDHTAVILKLSVFAGFLIVLF